ncbi:MAG: hypothetical protein ACTS4T_00730 [Candidatus Hodgkinia cicadicola]
MSLRNTSRREKQISRKSAGAAEVFEESPAASFRLNWWLIAKGNKIKCGWSPAESGELV